MEELLKLVELVKQEAPQARVKLDSLMVTHYFTMEELLNICNKYAEYKCALADVSNELFLAILDKYQIECQMKYNTGTVPDAREWFAKNYSC